MSPFRKARRILILHGGSLGDCVLAVHFAQAFRAGAKVTLVARSSIARWAAKHGWIDKARPLDTLSGYLWRSEEVASSQRDTDYLAGFDVVVSLLGGPDEPVSNRLFQDIGRRAYCIDPRPRLDPPSRPISPHGERLVEGWSSASQHIVDQWLGAMPLDEVVRIGEASQSPPGIVTMRDALATRMGPLPRPIVLVHPGSGGTAKCCPLESLEALVKSFRESGVNVAWIIGPDEMERHGLPYKRRLESSAAVLLEDSVESAADLVAGADAYVGMDAGMTHVAALAGVNTVALFGPTDPNVWRPLGRSVQVLRFPEFVADHADWIREIEHCVRRTPCPPLPPGRGPG